MRRVDIIPRALRSLGGSEAGESDLTCEDGGGPVRKTLLGGQGRAKEAATAAWTRKEDWRQGERSGWPRVQSRGSTGPDGLEAGVR